MKNLYVVVNELDKEIGQTYYLREARKMAIEASKKNNLAIWVIDWGRDVEIDVYKNGEIW